MAVPHRVPFAKMNGIGNSILVVDGRGASALLTGADARRLCEGELAFDQLMLILAAERSGVDATVRIFNADGSRAGACGNGSRCVAWYLMRGRQADTLILDIDGASVACRRDGERLFTVDMGRPGLDWRQVPLREPADTNAVDLRQTLVELGLPKPAAVGMGNPHAVFLVADAAAVDLAAVGPRIECHPMFPEGANVSIAQVIGRDRIELKVWERGAGATRACGSAACATLVAAARQGKTDRRARVGLPGGDLEIEWREDDHVMMTGPVELEFEAHLALDPLGATA